MSLKEERVAVADPSALAVERVLRRLGVAIKTFGLYPGQHPVATRALENLLAALRPYLAAYGPFVARISRQGLEVDAISYGGEIYVGLALHLYTRKLSMLTFLPAATDQEVASFLTIAGTDRASLESGGGVDHLLWQSSVGNVQVIEMALDEEQDIQALGLNAFLALIGQGRLAPREREAVLDILAADQAARLLYNIFLMAAEVFEGISEDARIEQVFQTVRTLDRLILDEPLEVQATLYTSLTEALLHVDEPLRSALPPVFATRAAEDTSAKFLLHQFSLEGLGELIVRALRPEDVASQVAVLLRGLGLPERTNTALTSLLEGRLRPPEAAPDWLHAQLRAHAASAGVGRNAEVPPEFVFDDSLIVIPQEAFAELVSEARAITETGAIREVIRTLVDILRDESDEKELPDVADALGAHFAWMVEQQEFGLLAAVLERLKRITATADDGRAHLADAIVRRITEHPLLDRLLDALWAGRETPVEEQVRRTLAVVADEAVTPLVRVLGVEPRSGMRSLLCDLLVLIARDHVRELAGFIGDERWYLVRNIANILGRLQHPDVVPHLERVIDHPEYRVRREVADALARVGTEAAQTLLVRLLDDADPRIQLRALEALNAWGARRAMPKLLALLQAPDPLQHLFQVKVAGLKALERLRATDALPLLKRIARSPLAVGQHRRELRDLARRAVRAVEGHA